MRAHPVKPADLKAPGLKWNPRETHWVAYWVANPDLVQRGWKPKTVRLWPLTVAPPEQQQSPTVEEWKEISSDCRLHQDKMHEWANGGDPKDSKSVYNGTFGSLVKIYQTDHDSPFREQRWNTQMSRAGTLATLDAAIGTRLVKVLTFRDFKRWVEAWRAPAHPGAPERPARAHAMISMVRTVVAFGAALELADCLRLHPIISGNKSGGTGMLRVTGSRRREVFMTAAQAVAIRAEAHRQGLPSIALLQALTFETGVRPGDFLGQWLPLAEPGTSDITRGLRKWLFGARWSDISDDLVLTVRVSKSIRGRHASGLAGTGKFERFNLRSYPMVMEEMTGSQFGQNCEEIGQKSSPTNPLILDPNLKPAGPLIVCEITGRPWDAKHYAHVWRAIARAAGVPDEVQSRDSRAGAITEGIDSGARLEEMRKVAGHSQIGMTARYDRGAETTRDRVAQLRNKSREGK